MHAQPVKLTGSSGQATVFEQVSLCRFCGPCCRLLRQHTLTERDQDGDRRKASRSGALATPCCDCKGLVLSRSML